MRTNVAETGHRFQLTPFLQDPRTEADGIAQHFGPGRLLLYFAQLDLIAIIVDDGPSGAFRTLFHGFLLRGLEDWLIHSAVTV